MLVLGAGEGHRLLYSEHRPGRDSVDTAGSEAQSWLRDGPRSLGGMLAELVWLFQVVESGDCGQLLQVMGVWWRDTQRRGFGGGGRRFLRPLGEREGCSRLSVTLATSCSPLRNGDLPPLWYFRSLPAALLLLQTLFSLLSRDSCFLQPLYFLLPSTPC